MTATIRVVPRSAGVFKGGKASNSKDYGKRQRNLGSKSTVMEGIPGSKPGYFSWICNDKLPGNIMVHTREDDGPGQHVDDTKIASRPVPRQHDGSGHEHVSMP